MASDTNDRTFIKNFVLTIAVLVGLTVVLIVLSVILSKTIDTRADERAELERERTEERLRPDGNVRIAGDAAPAAEEEPPEAADADVRAPEDVYAAACQVCHTPGAAGAPRTDDADAWAGLLDERGFDGLVNSVIDGRGAMPPRGGQPGLSDEEIRETVRWMLEENEIAVDE